MKPRYAIAIGLAVALIGSTGVIILSQHIGSSLHDHDTAIIVPLVISFIGGIFSGSIGAVVYIWLMGRN